MAKNEAALAPQKDARFVHTYPVPKGIQRTQSGKTVTSVSLAEITVTEEKIALKVAGDDEASRIYEAIKMSLVKVNGQRVSVGDGTADQWLHDMRPALRQLIGLAYMKLHSATAEDGKSFFDGAQVEVE